MRLISFIDLDASLTKYCHNLFLQVSSDELSVLLSAERLGALDGSTESAVNDQLRQNTESAGDTEEDGVVAGFGQAVVLQENAAVRVNVREGVFRLPYP